MLRQGLQQKLQQKLSPQQIQLMKLIQVPAATLDQRIKEELEANPALEMGEDLQSDADEETEDFRQEEEPVKEEEQDERADEEIDLTEYISDDDVADYKLRDTNYPDPEEDRTVPVRVSQTFHESLLQQLGMADLDDRQYHIAEQLIGSIDDDGYLRREMDAIVDDIAFAQNITTTEEELEELLAVVQELDPPGVGARTLQECLLLQLKRKDSNPNTRMAIRILEDHFDSFAKKHYDRLQKSLDLEEDELKYAIDEILKLNPKPGSAYSGSDKGQQYIVPDFTIENREGELVLRLNRENAPELRISSHFREMMKDYSKSDKKDKQQKEAVMFIKQKLDSAKWFIDAIKQRQNTLMSTMNAIMEYQYEFFLTGDETKMRPMILKDIAEETNMDISTISRVANSKYVVTEFGTFPLKYFFSESLTTDSGEEVSTREVKKILQDLIGNESKRRPLSDQRLMELLNEKGYNIARRTVAKYREQLNIPVARLRKEL
jgi:RNA polymerase sigma-54 factor